MEERHGMPVLGPMLEEGLYDPHDAPEHSRWLPFNREATELACCLEACKQVIELEPVFAGTPTSRAYTLLATPVYSLAEHTLNLHRMLGNRERANWPEADKKNFVGVARLLRKQMKGVLKKLRDKRSAHHDPEALHPSSGIPPADASVLLPPLGQALVVLILALNHNTTLAYYRLPDPAKPREVQIFVEYPMATLFRVDDSGRFVEPLEFRIAADPRHEASAIIRKAIDVYNAIAVRATPPQPPVDLVTRAHPDSKLASRKMKVRLL